MEDKGTEGIGEGGEEREIEVRYYKVKVEYGREWKQELYGVDCGGTRPQFESLSSYFS